MRLRRTLQLLSTVQMMPFAHDGLVSLHSLLKHSWCCHNGSMQRWSLLLKDPTINSISHLFCCRSGQQFIKSVVEHALFLAGMPMPDEDVCTDTDASSPHSTFSSSSDTYTQHMPEHHDMGSSGGMSPAEADVPRIAGPSDSTGENKGARTPYLLKALEPDSTGATSLAVALCKRLRHSFGDCHAFVETGSHIYKLHIPDWNADLPGYGHQGASSAAESCAYLSA